MNIPTCYRCPLRPNCDILAAKKFLPEFKAWALERKRAQRRASYLRCAGRVSQ